MKVIIVFFVLFCFMLNTNAFSEEKKQTIIEIKSKLWLLKNEKDINWYYKVKKNIENKILTQKNDTIKSILTEIKNEILFIIDSYALKNTIEEKENIDDKVIFINNHGNNIIQKIKLREWCTKYFDFVDEIAKENDFPTALILATWSKEFNCQLSNPSNWHGPFQISSQYYEFWDITLEDFWKIVQNYIDFTKWKMSYYNSNKDYKKRFWNEDIHITYNDYTLKDIRLYSVLYNGITKTTDIETNTFANGNLNENIISDTDGIVTLFIKILNWQIENNK